LEGKRFEFEGEDGIVLAAEAWGDPADPPVILAHGGGQTRHSWGGTAQVLAARGWYAVAYDHGESAWSPDSLYHVAHFALDMACLARSFDRPPAVVGASLGGMAAMLGAGEIQAELFACIVLVDVTPRLNLAGVQRIYDFMQSHIETGFASLEEAAEAIARYTGRERRGDLSGLRKNLRERDGRYYWHWDPNFFASREDGPGRPDRLLEAAARIRMPVLLIRGRASDVVTDAEVEEFMHLIPHAEFIDVDRARHMVAGDRNDIFTEAVVGFLERRQDPSRQRPGAGEVA
jgi:pimeloyl-ACP methyl ester carboxylesterase